MACVYNFDSLLLRSEWYEYLWSNLFPVFIIFFCVYNFFKLKNKLQWNVIYLLKTFSIAILSSLVMAVMVVLGIYAFSVIPTKYLAKEIFTETVNVKSVYCHSPMRSFKTYIYVDFEVPGYRDFGIKIPVRSCSDNKTQIDMINIWPLQITISGREWFLGRYVDNYEYI